MPLFEFHCNKCDKSFEYLVLGSDQPICPGCNGNNVNKLMSACGFVSKGKGGETSRRSAADTSCTGCSSTGCSTCH